MNTYLRRVLFAAAISFLIATPCALAAVALDENFRPPNFVEPKPSARVLSLPDGKLLRFYNTDTLVDQPSKPLTRYFPDGTLDSSFNFPSGYTNVLAAAALPNGKVIVAATQNIYRRQVEKILRLNQNGSIDTTFTATEVVQTTNTLMDLDGDVVGITFQPDGKIIVALYYSQTTPLLRLFADGGVDSSFPAVQLTGGTSSLALNTPLVQPDGKIIIYGSFTSVNGISLPLGAARLNADGSVDTSFQPSDFTISSFIFPQAAALQSDGKILLGGRFTVSASFAANPTGRTANLPIVRLNTNGSADQSYGYFNPPAGTIFRIRDLALQNDGKAVATNSTAERSVFRFLANGALDTSFARPMFVYRLQPTVTTGPVQIALQGDGKILVAGSFTDINDGSPLNDSSYGIVRLNANGTVDPSFVTIHKTGLNDYPTSFDRLIAPFTLIGFRNVSPSGETALPIGLGRLSPDGSLDPNFHPFSSTRYSDFVLTGFTRLASGKFAFFGRSPNPDNLTVGLLSPDGFEDTTFNSNQMFFGIDAVYALPDGGALVGSSNAQSLVDLIPPLQRADSALARDETFALDSSILSRQVEREQGILFRLYLSSRLLAVQRDGKIIFEYLAADDFHVVRLNSDGTIDSTFPEQIFTAYDLREDFPFVFDPFVGSILQPPDGAFSATPTITDAVVLPDDRVILAGHFTSYGNTPARGLVRLNADGTVDSTFQIGGGAQWTQTTESSNFFPSVEQIEPQSNGRLLIAGTFEAFNGTPAPGIASLNADGSVDTSFVAPAIRQKGVAGTAVLARQRDGSYLLSGPYSRPGESSTSSFIRIFGSPSVLNISTRAFIGSDPQVLIGGFIVTGDAPKKVIIRGIGPSLVAAGLPAQNILADPLLTLQGNNVMITNDDWRSTQESEIISYGFAPSDNRESVIIASLNPGAYTAVMSGKDNSSGIGLVEVYDLGNDTVDPTQEARLGNVSTRGFVQGGDNVLIGGFIVRGIPSRTVVRAIGPSLANSNVPGALQDPVLEIHDANGAVTTNDDWRSTQEQEIMATNLAPTDDRESAIVANFLPGAYTAIVRGKNNTTGVALIEAFNLD